MALAAAWLKVACFQSVVLWQLRALPGKVIGRLAVIVAGLAVGGFGGGMVKGGGLPGAGAVALRALPGPVIGGLAVSMAGLAVGGLGGGMVEGGGLPGIGAVALRTLPVPVIGRFIFGVAGNAVGSRAAA